MTVAKGEDINIQSDTLGSAFSSIISLYCSTSQLDLPIMLMLSESEITLGGISTMCGYSDISPLTSA